MNVPILVQACDDENDKVDLDSRRDAFCGKISVCNNLYQYGIPFTDTTLHTYSIYSELLAKDINKFAGICRVVNGLRHARIGAIGARPAGFHTVTSWCFRQSLAWLWNGGLKPIRLMLWLFSVGTLWNRTMVVQLV